jgi:acyl-CoA thioester hydrolase
MKQVTSLTVRHYECDSYGHVNHAVYVNYLELARMQFLRAARFDYAGLVAAGFITIISRLDISYRSPAFADDVLAIETEPGETRRVSGAFHQVIRRGKTVIAEADVNWCVVNQAGRPARPPEQFDLRRLVS